MNHAEILNSPAESLWSRFIRRARIAASRVAAALFLCLAMVSEHRWPEDGFMDSMMEIFGYLLVLACTLGRIWCSLYIAGRKSRELVTEGPYALSRNPLYFFSFLGALGVAFATETFTFPVIVLLVFAWYYPQVIKEEERKLRQLFGQQFEEYASRTPRFFIRLQDLRRLEEPQSYTINPMLVRKELQNVGWFITLFLIVHSFEWLHHAKLLPVWLRLY